MADPTPAPMPAQTARDPSARTHQIFSILFPSNFASKAVLFAVVVALLPLLPSQASSKIWEVPHLLLLGIVISYGIFGQKNADHAPEKADETSATQSYVSQMMQGSLVFDGEDGEGGGGGKDVIDRAWNSQYYPDDPLVMVAGARSNGEDGARNNKPLLLPVRRLKPAIEESETGDVNDGIDEDRDFDAYKAGFGVVGERNIPPPSSVLDADLSLSSPSSSPPAPPPPPPFLVHGHDHRTTRARSFNDGSVKSSSKKFRSDSTKKFTKSTTSSFAHYDSYLYSCDQSFGADEAVKHHQDEEEEETGELDEMIAASDTSLSSDLFSSDGNDGDDDDKSCIDEELFELAMKAAPEDEVDRKADEFIAKFRQQIWLQS